MILLALSLPPKELHPNSRVHWAAKARAVKAYRQQTGIMTLLWQHLHWKRVTVQATFYFKTSRRRDGDNLLASLKPAFDGLVDAGVLVDDSGITHLPVTVKIDKENPRVELRIKESPGAAICIEEI